MPVRTTDWRELLTAGLDVVSIATPTFLHGPMTISAARAGIHVLCEKPIAQDSATAQQMVRAAQQAGTVLDVAFNHRQRGEVRALAAVIDSGVLGGSTTPRPAGCAVRVSRGWVPGSPRPTVPVGVR